MHKFVAWAQYLILGGRGSSSESEMETKIIITIQIYSDVITKSKWYAAVIVLAITENGVGKLNTSHYKHCTQNEMRMLIN